MRKRNSLSPAILTAYAFLLAGALLLASCESKEETPETDARGAVTGAADGAAQPATAAPAKPAEGRLNVYMYSEYIDPALPGLFEKATGLKVRIDVYEAAEEMMGKLQHAGGVSQYDVVVASNYLIPVMAQLGLLQPLDMAKIPNKVNMDPMFVNPPYDPGNKHGLAYQWGTIGLMYRKDKAPDIAKSWQAIFDPAKQPGPFVMMDETRPMLSAALIVLGKSINTRDKADLQAAGELLLKAKASKSCLGFDGGVGGKNKVVAGEAVMAVVYNGDAVKAMPEEPNAAFFVPEEGTMLWVDCMMIPAKAPNADGAHRFIDFILDAKVGAQLSNFNRYATPNQAAMEFIKPEDKANAAIYPTPEQLKKMQYVEDMGKDMPLYDEVWTSVKSR